MEVVVTGATRCARLLLSHMSKALKGILSDYVKYKCLVDMSKTICPATICDVVSSKDNI